MGKPPQIARTTEDLEVDKAEFDRALKKLIATPPIRKADLVGKRKPWDRRPPRSSSSR